MKRISVLGTPQLLVLLLVCALERSEALAGGNETARINPELLTKVWSARWIAVPSTSPFDYGVYHFRRTFEIPSKPSSFVIHVSGDNRYQLWVNGERVVWGPARGDLHHWRFETVDIASHLKAGKNVLAAVVWNFAQFAPEAQITNQTGFLLQGDTAAERIVDTGASWKCIKDEAYAPLQYTSGAMRGYFVVGPGERIDAGRYLWDWQTTDFDDSKWSSAQVVLAGAPRDARDAPSRWMLVPRNIPLMEEKPERLAAVRQSAGVSVPANFPQQKSAFTIPANTKARLLLDHAHLTTAYPELVVSGGEGAVIEMGYAESLFNPGTQRGNKGNRNEVEGKEFLGYYDIFTSDGGSQRMFRPLWWRTYRYIDLKIQTKDKPLTIEDLRGIYTGYPFEFKARFDAGSERLTKFLEVGWRTARLDAHETYMDCPYYEQLQYVGDTRIQCLVSLYNSGDARLMKNAIAQINDSRTAEGATMSRAPTRTQQYIPPFSLWWIGMVHDYWQYQDDPEFVREMLPGVRAVLGFYGKHEKPNGSLGLMPWWNYVDWAWKSNGVPPVETDGSSSSLDLQLLLAIDWASDLEDALGSKRQGAEFREEAAKLRATVKQIYWDSSRQLFADTPLKKEFSQQPNALAVLARVVEGADARSLVNRVLADSSITQCTYYFRHYLHSAANQVGEGDRYLDLLGEWDKMLARGLTTWAETPDPSRSDCHAWSASPNYELFRTVLGIDSGAPGFKRVIIRPHLGKLTRVSGAIPHPKGEVAVKLTLRDEKLEAEVSLPASVTGEFVWRGARRPLKPGMNRLLL